MVGAQIVHGAVKPLGFVLCVTVLSVALFSVTLLEGHYSHLAPAPEAAVSWGRKELGVSGRSTAPFYPAALSLCFSVYPGESSLGGAVQKIHFAWEKTFFSHFHATAAAFLPAKIKGSGFPEVVMVSFRERRASLAHE